VHPWRREVGACQEMAYFSLGHSPEAVMLKHYWYTKRWKQGGRERERVSGRTEGLGGRRSSQSDTICSSSPTGSASILSSLTVCVYMWNWAMCQCQSEEGCWVWSNTGVLANEKLKAQSRRPDETELRKHCTIETTQSDVSNAKPKWILITHLRNLCL